MCQLPCWPNNVGDAHQAAPRAAAANVSTSGWVPGHNGSRQMGGFHSHGATPIKMDENWGYYPIFGNQHLIFGDAHIVGTIGRGVLMLGIPKNCVA